MFISEAKGNASCDGFSVRLLLRYSLFFTRLICNLNCFFHFSFFIRRDERTVSRAIELNEQLQKVLARHEDLVSGRTTTTANEQIPKDLPRHDNVVSARATTTSNEQFPKVLPRRGDLVSGRVTTNANEQLPKVLPKRDDVVSGRATATVATHFDLEESEEEEEPEQLVRRYTYLDLGTQFIVFWISIHLSS